MGNLPVSFDILDVLVDAGAVYRLGEAPVDGIYPCIIGGLSERPNEHVTLIDGLPTILSQTLNKITLTTEPIDIITRGLTYQAAVNILSSVTSVLDALGKFRPAGKSYTYQNVIVKMPMTYLGRDEKKRFLVMAKYDTRRW